MPLQIVAGDVDNVSGKAQSEKFSVEALKKRRRREVDRRERLEEIVKQERSNSAAAIREVEARWMPFFRHRKWVELQGDIERIRNTFTNDLSRRDAEIIVLRREISHMEEQYQTSLQSHLMTVNSLATQQDRQKCAQKKEFESTLSDLERKFAEGHFDMGRKHTATTQDLKLIIQNMKNENESAYTSLRDSLSESHQLVRRKKSEEFGKLQNHNSSRHKDLRNQCDNFAELVDSNNPIMEDFSNKMVQEEEAADILQEQKKQIRKVRENIATLRSNANKRHRENESRNSHLRAEKETINIHVKELQRKLQARQDFFSRSVRELIYEANNTYQSLSGSCHSLDRIIRLMGFISDLLVEGEDHLAPARNANRGPLVTNSDRPRSDVVDLRTSHDFVAHLSNAAIPKDITEVLWTKYNLVVLDNTTITEEKRRLSEENTLLRQSLKKYLDCYNA